jgi:hypothetical protein
MLLRLRKNVRECVSEYETGYGTAVLSAQHNPMTSRCIYYSYGEPRIELASIRGPLLRDEGNRLRMFDPAPRNVTPAIFQDHS